MIPFRKIKHTPQYKTQKALHEHYESLFHSWVWELRFRLLQIENLQNALEEVQAMTNDRLAKQVCKLAIERNELDKMIHARTLFPDN
jgi:hypothetical protein